MSKWMFFGTPLAGHTNPTLPVVAELVGRGEQVVYYNSERFRNLVEATGAEFRSYQSLPALPAQLSRRMPRLIPWICQSVEAFLDTELAPIRANPPDFVIYDCVAVWGAEVARLLNVPPVGSVPTFACNAAVEEMGKKIMPKENLPGRSGILVRDLPMLLAEGWRRARTSRRHGLKYKSLFDLAHADFNLLFTSTALQPCAGMFEDRFCFVGSPGADRKEEHTFAFEDLNGLPLVYVSLGTSVNERPGFYESCFKAFGDMNVQVLLSHGKQQSEMGSLKAPKNFLIRDYVPQLAILRRAAVFITHGGVGSASEALHFGVPQIFLPQIWDGYFMAHQVSKAGAGIVLSENPTIPELRETVERVLAEPTFRERSQELGRGLEATGGAPRAADELIKWAAARNHTCGT